MKLFSVFACFVAISFSVAPWAHAVDLAQSEPSQPAPRRPVLRASSSIAELTGVETPRMVIVNGSSTVVPLDRTLAGSFPRVPEPQPSLFESITSVVSGGAQAGPSHNCGAGGASGSVLIDQQRFYYRIGSDGNVELRDNVRVGGPFWRVRTTVSNVTVGDFIARLPQDNEALRMRALQNEGVERLATFLPAGARATFETSLTEALALPRFRSAELVRFSPDVQQGVGALRRFCREGFRDCETSSRRVALVPFLVQRLSRAQATVPVTSLVIERCRASDGQCVADTSKSLLPDREVAEPPRNATEADISRLSREIESYRRAFSRRRGIRGEPLDVVLSPSGRWEITGLADAVDPDDEGLEGFRTSLGSLRERLVRASTEQAAYQRRTGAYLAENRAISDVQILSTSDRLIALHNCCKDTACRQDIVATGAVRDAGTVPSGGVQSPSGSRTEN